jgi:hypothetical protein
MQLAPERGYLAFVPSFRAPVIGVDGEPDFMLPNFGSQLVHLAIACGEHWFYPFGAKRRTSATSVTAAAGSTARCCCGITSGENVCGPRRPCSSSVVLFSAIRAPP